MIIAAAFGVPFLDSRASEISNIIRRSAALHTDATHPCLGFDDMVAEGWQKVMTIYTKEQWQRFESKPRAEFFKYVKTAVNNHLMSLVARYRLTSKRGYDASTQAKRVDISIDADDGVDVPDASTEPFAASGLELLRDFAVMLDPVERLILAQRHTPNDAAVVYAYLDRPAESRSLKIKTEHQAAGLGLPTDLYTAKLTSLLGKLKIYMQDPTRDSSFWSHVRVLEEVFKVKTPPHLDHVVVRRLMAIAARDQYELVTDDVAVRLRAINVPVPAYDQKSERLQCYGILFKEGHRACASCTLNASCKVTAQNLGLGTITIDSQLMPAGQQRCPTAGEVGAIPDCAGDDLTVSDDSASTEAAAPTAEANPAPEPPALSVVDDHNDSLLTTQLMDHLRARLTPAKSGSTLYFYLKGAGKRPIYPFNYVGGSPRRLDDVVPIRVCAPSAEVRARLVRAHGGYYVPETMTYDEAAEIFDMHINDRGKTVAD